MDAKQFRTLFMVLHNTGRAELEQAGIIVPGAKGGSDWTRFNEDLTTFVLKLPDDHLAKLVGLVAAEMPADGRVEMPAALRDAEYALTNLASTFEYDEDDGELASCPYEYLCGETVCEECGCIRDKRDACRAAISKAEAA